MSRLRIQRYLLSEISIPALLSLVIFTFVLLMGRIPRVTELVINKGVPALEVLRLFAYLMPTFLTITAPLSFLLGILLAFGRLSADSEYIALKASGVGLYTLVRPVLLLAVVFTLFTAGITLFLEPACKSAFRNQLFEIASRTVDINLRPGVFNDDFPGIVMFAGGVTQAERRMRDIFISDEREGQTPAAIFAQQGRFISDPDTQRLTLRLENGSIHRQPRSQAKQDRYQIIRFTNYDINLSLNESGQTGTRRRSHSELSWTELNRALSETSRNSARLALLAEKHERIVIAFAPLVLVLVGIPLGLQSQRSGKGAGFSLALVIFLVYYVLLSLAGTVADEGWVPAAVIFWLPNLCFFAGGLYFLHRAAIERPLPWSLALRPWRRVRNCFRNRRS